MDNTPIITKPVETIPGIENEVHSIEDRDCCDFTCFWILQILLWLFIISEIVLLIIFEFKTNTLIWVILGVFAFFYIIYINMEINSDEPRYLRNIISIEQLYQILKKHIKSIPEIYIKVNCSHEERLSADSSGPEAYVRETTFETSVDFPYLSTRDVSGVFSLNFDDKKIYYLKLDLDCSLEYADNTRQDIGAYINYYYAKYRDKDVDISVNDEFRVPGVREDKDYKDLKLIKLGEKGSCLANNCAFFLCTLLTLAELYKIYFRSICVYKKYYIRKLVSSRYDITKPEFEDVFKDRNPCIDIKNQAYFYEHNEYTYLNHKFPKPKKEEINNPEQNNNAQNYLYSTGDKNNNKDGNNIDTGNVDNNINTGKSVELPEINNLGYIPPA